MPDANGCRWRVLAGTALALTSLVRTRKRLRHPTHDYAAPGAYMVTVCTWARRPILADASAQPTAAGDVVARHWADIPAHWAGVLVEPLVVMPDHVHGIVWLKQVPHSADARLSDVVGGFKSGAVRELRRLALHDSSPVWQRSYHDRVIRNDRALAAIRRYLQENPMALVRRWRQPKGRTSPARPRSRG